MLPYSAKHYSGEIIDVLPYSTETLFRGDN